MKNLFKFVLLIGWSFALLVGVYAWHNNTAKEREARKRQEILSDTAAVNRAQRIYERIHHQLLMEDPDYMELLRENDSLKKQLQEIRDSIYFSRHKLP